MYTKEVMAKAKTKTKSILQYAIQRTSSIVHIDYDVKDKLTRFTYSEMLSFIELYNGKKTELVIIKAGLIKTVPPTPPPGGPPKPMLKSYIAHIPSTKMTVLAYKNWLRAELQKLAGASDNDEIEMI